MGLAGRWGPTTFPGREKGGAPSASRNLRLGHAWQRASIPLEALPTLLSSLGAFCQFELRVFQTFLDILRCICSGHGYPVRRAASTSRPRSDRFWLCELLVSRTFLYQLRPQLLRPWTPSGGALPTLPVRARTVSGCLNSAFLGLFYTSCGPSFSGHGLPTQRASKTSCPARPLRPQVSPCHSLSLTGPGFLAASVAFSLASGLPASRVSISVVSFSRMSGL